MESSPSGREDLNNDHDEYNEAEGEYKAMIEFLSTFKNLSRAPPTNLSDLNDGIVLHDALSEIAPTYFFDDGKSTSVHSTTLITRDECLKDNWILRLSNLRRLTRILEEYYYKELNYTETDDNNMWKTTTSFSYLYQNLYSIAKDSNPEGIATLVKLIIIAALTSPDNKNTYITNIMEDLSFTSQMHIKNMVESTLQLLKNCTKNNDATTMINDNNDCEVRIINTKCIDTRFLDGNNNGGSSVFYFTTSHVGDDHQKENTSKMTIMKPNDESRFEEEEVLEEQPVEEEEEEERSERATNNICDEKDVIIRHLRIRLEEEIKEKVQLTKDLNQTREELQEQRERNHKYSTLLMKELRENLDQKDNDISKMKQELNETKIELYRTNTKLVDLEQEKAQLDDDYDIARSEINQLRKNRFLMEIYQKKIQQDVQQMDALESQVAALLEQQQQQHTTAATELQQQEENNKQQQQQQRLEEEEKTKQQILHLKQENQRQEHEFQNLVHELESKVNLLEQEQEKYRQQVEQERERYFVTGKEEEQEREAHHAEQERAERCVEQTRAGAEEENKQKMKSALDEKTQRVLHLEQENQRLECGLKQLQSKVNLLEQQERERYRQQAEQERERCAREEEDEREAHREVEEERERYREQHQKLNKPQEQQQQQQQQQPGKLSILEKYEAKYKHKRNNVNNNNVKKLVIIHNMGKMMEHKKVEEVEEKKEEGGLLALTTIPHDERSDIETTASVQSVSCCNFNENTEYWFSFYDMCSRTTTATTTAATTAYGDANNNHRVDVEKEELINNIKYY